MKQGSTILLVVVAIVIVLSSYFLLSGDDTMEQEAGQPASAVEESAAIGETPSLESSAEEPPESPADTAQALASDDAGQVAALSQGDAPVVAPNSPSFDIIRVEPSGDAIFAGRAPGKSEVTIVDGGADLGKVESDLTGNWVFIPERPLAPGTHELKLKARLSDGTVLWSREAAVIVVPEPKIASAASAPSQTLEALVVLVPEGGDTPTKVLQRAIDEENGGIVEGALALDTIDYDEDGRAIIAGRAPAGSMIIAYLDNRPIAVTTSDDSGRWQTRPEARIEPGLHSLRIDQVSEDGTVVARVETPFSRAAEVEKLAQVNSIVVQPGNSLWRIARRVYGKGIRFSVIFQANAGQIQDPDLIYPGQIFKVPETEN